MNIQVILVPLKRNLKNRRQLLESDKLERILLAIVICLILVCTVETLFFDIGLHAFLDIIVSANSQLDRIELVVPTGLIIDLDTLDDVLDIAFKEPVESALDRRVLHLFIELVTELTVELVDILLGVYVL